MAPHSSGAVRILADPISTGQPPSDMLIPAHTTHTRCCDVSNRILSVGSPVVASLILQAGVIFFMSAHSLRWARYHARYGQFTGTETCAVRNSLKLFIACQRLTVSRMLFLLRH